MSATKQAENYPLFVHFYGSDGNRRDPVRIEDVGGLKAIMKGRIYGSVKAGFEVRITNTHDSTVFHAQHGKVIFPEGGDIERTQQA